MVPPMQLSGVPLLANQVQARVRGAQRINKEGESERREKEPNAKNRANKHTQDQEKERKQTTQGGGGAPILFLFTPISQ